MEMARALVQTAVERYEIREVPVPEPGEDGAILRVEACGLCGSDVEAFRGVLNDLSFPIAPGHEAVGVIDQIGPTASETWRLAEGDRCRSVFDQCVFVCSLLLLFFVGLIILSIYIGISILMPLLISYIQI